MHQIGTWNTKQGEDANPDTRKSQVRVSGQVVVRYQFIAVIGPLVNGQHSHHPIAQNLDTKELRRLAHILNIECLADDSESCIYPILWSSCDYAAVYIQDVHYVAQLTV